MTNTITGSLTLRKKAVVLPTLPASVQLVDAGVSVDAAACAADVLTAVRTANKLCEEFSLQGTAEFCAVAAMFANALGAGFKVAAYKQTVQLSDVLLNEVAAAAQAGGCLHTMTADMQSRTDGDVVSAAMAAAITAVARAKGLTVALEVSASTVSRYLTILSATASLQVRISDHSSRPGTTNLRLGDDLTAVLAEISSM